MRHILPIFAGKSFPPKIVTPKSGRLFFRFPRAIYKWCAHLNARGLPKAASLLGRGEYNVDDDGEGGSVDGGQCCKCCR